MSKFGMGILGLVCLANALWLLYEHPDTAVFNYWPLVLLNGIGFLFSLTAFFKLAIRRNEKEAEPTRPSLESPPPGSAEEKVG